MYDQNVFVNCPFDEAYQPIFRAIVFAIHDCGFVARSALEESDSGDVRVTKIEEIIRQSRLGIHDVSRTEVGEPHGLPRFNMPLELGLFLGAKRFGGKTHKRKACLILDRERFRYQVYMSDIAGQDIGSHGGTPAGAVRAVRDWLSHFTDSDTVLPGARTVARRYAVFTDVLPTMLGEHGIDLDELIHNDYTTFVVAWLRANPLRERRPGRTRT